MLVTVFRNFVSRVWSLRAWPQLCRGAPSDPMPIRRYQRRNGATDTGRSICPFVTCNGPAMHVVIQPVMSLSCSNAEWAPWSIEGMVELGFKSTELGGP